MNSFTIYKEYYDLITLLSEEEQQELLLAIAKYMFEDIEPNLSERQMKVFRNLKRPLDISKNNSKRSKGNIKENQTEEQTKKETENKPKTNQTNNQTVSEKQTHQDVNVYVNVNGNVKENNKGVIGGKEETIVEVLDTKQKLYVDIIGYLNAKTGSNYRATTPKTKQFIQARLNEGFTAEDFKTVIDNKCLDWLRNNDMKKYLRPETLFGTKFESYLNQPSKEITTKDLPFEYWDF